MTNPTPNEQQTEHYLRLWIYLLPIVGVIPALWTLYQARQKDINHSPEIETKVMNSWRQQKKASRLAINLVLVWLGSYALFSLGATQASELNSFRLLYANAIITSGYFLTCTFLLTRLGKKSLFSAE